MPDWLDTRTLLIIAHLLGVALGAGGAYMSDAIFLFSMKDHKLSKTEIDFMALGSKVVWVGLALLILSGVGLFATATEHYMESTKFLAKMSIVLILTINGLVFKFKHFPYIQKFADQYLDSAHAFNQNSKALFISGAISGVSWTSALILGALSGIPASYTTIMLVYLAIVAVAICGSLTMRKWHIRKS